MIKKTVSILLIVLLVFLSGCSSVITEGEVYKKEYRPKYTTVTVLPLVITNGKSSTTTMVPYIISYPDRYVIFIKAYKDKEWKTEDFYVSKDLYDLINIGDMFSFEEGRGDLEYEPYTTERKE